MRRPHGYARIVLTEEEAFALEADRSKWPPNWTVLSRHPKMKKLH